MARLSPSLTRSPAVLRRRLARILAQLDRDFHGRRVELEASDPWQLLVATILSAQCTDDRVNRVTPGLFATYRTPADFAAADRETLEGLIRSTGFFRAKARHLSACGRVVQEQFGGAVPRTMEELVTLPGVGRKTANVLLGNAFGRPAVVVDTHVKRVARRLGLTASVDPVRIEFDLRALAPQARWTSGSHHLLLHGRHVCVARQPRCERCSIYDQCDAPEKRPVRPPVTPASSRVAGPRPKARANARTDR